MDIEQGESLTYNFYFFPPSSNLYLSESEIWEEVNV